MALRWRLAQEAELRWWKMYLRGGHTAGYLNRKAQYWRRVLSEAACDPGPGACVLDAGCGPAGVFMVLRDQIVDAVDPLIDRYEAKLGLFRKSSYPNVRFWAEKLEDFQPESLYSWVFCFNAINHVRDIERCLDVLNKALAPGGTLVISVDAHRFAVLKALFRALPGDILHPHQHDDAGYTAMLERRGLVLKQKKILKEEAIFRHYLYVAQKTT